MVAALVQANAFLPVIVPLTLRWIKYCSWEYVLILSPLSLVLTPIGQYFVMLMPIKIVGLLLGIVVLVAATFKGVLEIRDEIRNRSKKKKENMGEEQPAPPSEEDPDASFLPTSDSVDGEGLELAMETSQTPSIDVRRHSLPRRIFRLLKTKTGAMLLLTGVGVGESDFSTPFFSLPFFKKVRFFF